ncbi:MAG: hypothetical protein Q8R16_02650 [bacterium]|nr:hypothetical protein [bacterium]
MSRRSNVQKRRRPKRWNALRAYRKILEQHGPRSRAERAFWRTRLLGNCLTADLAERLVALRRDAIIAPIVAVANRHLDELNAAIEPYRGKNVYLAVSQDDQPLKVLAADADTEKLVEAARATGRDFVLMGSPPASDAPVVILSVVG